jgi:hypothetical protein
MVGLRFESSGKTFYINQFVAEKVSEALCEIDFLTISSAFDADTY